MCCPLLIYAKKNFSIFELLTISIKLDGYETAYIQLFRAVVSNEFIFASKQVQCLVNGFAIIKKKNSTSDWNSNKKKKPIWYKGAWKIKCLTTQRVIVSVLSIFPRSVLDWKSSFVMSSCLMGDRSCCLMHGMHLAVCVRVCVFIFICKEWMINWMRNICGSASKHYYANIKIS